MKENKEYWFCGKQAKLRYEGNPIFVAKAPEPEDIYWDKLNAGTLKKLVSRALNYGLIGVLLAGHFAFCTWLTSKQVALSFFLRSITTL